MINGGFVLVDLTNKLIQIGSDNVVNIQGITHKLEIARKCGKPLVLKGITEENSTFAPLPARYVGYSYGSGVYRIYFEVYVPGESEVWLFELDVYDGTGSNHRDDVALKYISTL